MRSRRVGNRWEIVVLGKRKRRKQGSGRVENCGIGVSGEGKRGEEGSGVEKVGTAGSVEVVWTVGNVETV